MASTYSPSLKLELVGNGDQSGTWGTTTNNNLGTLLEQAITGVQTITMSNANYVLTDYNGISDEARNAVLVVTGSNSAVRQIVCPLVNKLYVVYNNTSGGYAITIGGTTGSVVTIPNGITAQVYCNGTNFYSSQTGSAGDFTVNGSFYATGNEAVTGNMLVGGTLGVTGATTFTGIPSGPTASAGTNTTQLATTAFVTSATAGLGTMATQNANAVAITGGTINGVTGSASGFTAGNVSGTVAIANGGTNLTSVGTSGNVLTSNGSAWVSSPVSSPAGSIIQVYQATNSTIYTFTGTSDLTGLSITLTPKNSSSKFLIQFNLGTVQIGNTVAFYVQRNGTNLTTASGGTYNGMAGTINSYNICSYSFVDSPDTASSITYKVTGTTDGTTAIGGRSSDNFLRTSQTFIIMEIAG